MHITAFLVLLSQLYNLAFFGYNF